MNEYLTIQEMADLWGISHRRVGVLCTEGRIPGATKMGPIWVIPKNAAKPVDARLKDNKSKIKGKMTWN